jgi:hypothetical protein
MSANDSESEFLVSFSEPGADRVEKSKKTEAKQRRSNPEDAQLLSTSGQPAGTQGFLEKSSSCGKTPVCNQDTQRTALCTRGVESL